MVGGPAHAGRDRTASRSGASRTGAGAVSTACRSLGIARGAASSVARGAGSVSAMHSDGPGDGGGDGVHTRACGGDTGRAAAPWLSRAARERRGASGESASRRRRDASEGVSTTDAYPGLPPPGGSNCSGLAIGRSVCAGGGRRRASPATRAAAAAAAAAADRGPRIRRAVPDAPARVLPRGFAETA
jgi:hypothetical protein